MIAWTAPRTWVANDILTAAQLNAHVRDNLLETAVAKATAAGEVPYATAANALAMLSPTASEYLRFNSGATALESVDLTDVAKTLAGIDTVDATTTSTSRADLSSVSGLTIEVTDTLVIEFIADKSSGHASNAELGVKLNATEMFTGSVFVPFSSTDQSEKARVEFYIPMRGLTNRTVTALAWRHTASGTAATLTEKMSGSDRPNAQLTSVTITGEVQNALNTLSVDNLRVYQLPGVVT